ncbi:hypothetical protein [Tropicimonas sp. IMCC34043]|uniref:hypothetical protein n=1 Tax=Tropicimonas sp. IMCC34043 TaxID=2248760 RepID=UPI000E22489F|nr:hypothetical protein [Tropicimonas sp. IMCC34043]
MQIARISAFIACATAALPALAQAQGAGAACDPADQLVCTCKQAGYTFQDPQWAACFIGDVNFPTVTQVDPLSSRAFVALNWPVSKATDGKVIVSTPDFTAPRQGDWTTVWDTWKSTASIFRPGKPPLPWDSTEHPLPAACSEIDAKAAMAAVPFADKIPNDIEPRLLSTYVNPDGDALLDAAGQPVRYESLFNRQAYDYTVAHGLWDAVQLESYLKAQGKLDLPSGTWGSNPNDPPVRGAIIAKAAWKILDAKDDPERFHKSWAYVTPVIDDGRSSHDCALVPVGLVGMHLVYKTATMPDWAWGTFEHVDAAPLWSQIGATGQGHFQDGKPVPDWIFYDVDQAVSRGPNWPPKTALEKIPSLVVQNYPPGYYFGPVSPGGAASSGNDPCPPSNQEFSCINIRMHMALEGSVFENYHLKGTQWKQYGPSGVGVPVPEILGNTVIETFTQNESNCLQCHALARPDWTGAKRGMLDFIFAFDQYVLQRSAAVQGN